MDFFRVCMALAFGASLVIIAPSAMADGTSGEGKPGHATLAGPWSVKAGSTLQTTLHAWAVREGWELVWDAPQDYRIRASARLGPDFQSAVKALADAVNQTSPDLTVTLYLGNQVIHVLDANPINN